MAAKIARPIRVRMADAFGPLTIEMHLTGTVRAWLGLRLVALGCRIMGVAFRRLVVRDAGFTLAKGGPA